MKTAQQSAEKYANRASGASGDYVDGARGTSKDQSAAAIAAFEIYKQALTKSFTEGSFTKGLGKSGKAKWLHGVTTVGGNRFAEGVGAAQGSYASGSAKFDQARGAADALPRGIKGSPQNLARVTAVVNALLGAKKTA